MAKKKRKPKKTSTKYKLYKVTGDKVERKNRFCPKCGAGVFLSQHKDRVVCGSCQYMEKTSK
ncbi:MAG TPA: 30S ribosomal protein S27ae [Candidatus Nanoarchaeia archaeon]|nr:30S ribosomal protein S27ae [Candidatus Nanoarchaeia archaeon]